ncbi:hypothetical protein Tco_1010827 [Tanacetum coccineum]
MYHNLNQLQWLLEIDNFHGHDSKTCLDVLIIQFKEFFDSKEVNALDFHNKCWQKDFKDYARCEPETYRQREVQAIKAIQKRHKEREIRQQESLSTNGTTLDASLVTECITLDDNLVVKESSDDSVPSSEQLIECNISMEMKDTVTSCFDSKEQHMQQLQKQASNQKEIAVKRIFSQNMDKLEEQLTKEKLHENDSKTPLTALMTPFQWFFHSEWPMYNTFKSRDDFQKYTGKYTQIFKDTMIRNIDAIEKYLIEVDGVMMPKRSRKILYDGGGGEDKIGSKQGEGKEEKIFEMVRNERFMHVWKIE